MAIVSFILAIWDFIKSEGEEEAKKKWWNRIRFMMIGVLLTIVLLFLLPLWLQALGVVGYDAFTAQAIFARVGTLITQILSIGNYASNFYQSGWAWFDFSDAVTTPSRTDYAL
jgi:hypothetical protein